MLFRHFCVSSSTVFFKLDYNTNQWNSIISFQPINMSVIVVLRSHQIFSASIFQNPMEPLRNKIIFYPDFYTSFIPKHPWAKQKFALEIKSSVKICWFVEIDKLFIIYKKTAAIKFIPRIRQARVNQNLQIPRPTYSNHHVIFSR